IELSEVAGIERADGGYKVVTTDGEFEARSVIIAAGSKHRMLGVAREEDFVGEGVSYCAVCDGAFYKGRTVAIIGGGNTALQEANLLADGCTKVYVVQNLAFMTGERSLLARLEARDNVEIIYSMVVDELLGESVISGVKIKNPETGDSRTLEVDGIFVAIGQIPENEPFADAVKLNSYGYIEAGEDCMPVTELPGIFVAGDCRTKSVRQVTTATADGAVAALAACRYIDSM
ncbi:MAG: FAD-dependent oxidoreductase, partial [Clostridia bacterium]|nr:FAD-dependent oxidoreductase [Clostridia bacterium]